MALDRGCTPDASGFGYCGECSRKLREKIWREMPAAQKRYDRHFDPAGSKELDDAVYGESCSCHINPPCGYCVNKQEEEEDEKRCVSTCN
jgi:hypothetical protein